MVFVKYWFWSRQNFINRHLMRILTHSVLNFNFPKAFLNIRKLIDFCYLFPIEPNWIWQKKLCLGMKFFIYAISFILSPRASAKSENDSPWCSVGDGNSMREVGSAPGWRRRLTKWVIFCRTPLFSDLNSYNEIKDVKCC
jgi:hypothetical protein